MEFSFLETQKRVKDLIALKGDNAAYDLAEWAESLHLGLPLEQIREIKDKYSKGYSGNRIAELTKLPATKVYKVINYSRQ